MYIYEVVFDKTKEIHICDIVKRFLLAPKICCYIMIYGRLHLVCEVKYTRILLKNN